MVAHRPRSLRGTRRTAAATAAVGALVTALAAFVLAVTPAAADHPAPAGAAPAARALAAEQWTESLRALLLAYQQADEAARRGLELQIAETAARRATLLEALIALDPAAVRRAALPVALRAALPGAARAHVEEDLELDGTLELLHADGGARSGHYWALVTPLGRFALYWTGAEPKGRLTGDRVRVRGLRVGLALALGAAEVVAVAPAPLPNAFGPQSTIVMLVNFTDKATQPFTRDDATALVFGTVSDFYRENSFDQTWLTGVVRGWYTIAESALDCDYERISNLANQAATADGVNLANYSRRVYAFPSNGCDWAGLGSVGGNPSRSWINGAFSLGVVGHELGHNLGLYHSHALDCGAATFGGSCSSIEYGDTLDIMGTGANHFNAPQKERLGWLGFGSSPAITAVAATGTYALSPYETAEGGPKALKIPRPAGGAFYVELRRALGFDASLAGNANVENGVVVHWANGPDDIYLLDMTPAGSAWWDPALVVGQSFSDAQVTIAPLAVGAGGASVSVTVGPVPCTALAPTVSISPAGTVWARPGDSPTYTVSVRNNDQAACSPATFALSASPGAGGFTAQILPASLTVGAGGTASASMTLTVPGAIADGLYQIGVFATRAGGGPSGSASPNVMVASSLGVGLNTDRPVYRRFQLVTVTARVTANGAPVSGVPTTFTVTKADGVKVSAVAMSNVSGVATYRYWVRWTDKKGPWSVKATANRTPLTGSATRTFEVQ